MKQWAIKTPRGKLIYDHTCKTKLKAWDYALCEDNQMFQLWMYGDGYDFKKDAPKIFERAGYTCVRVEVKEVES